MTEIIVKPFQACGPINTGDEFVYISKTFPDHTDFRKSPFSEFVTSSIWNGNFHIYYSSSGKCIGAELFPPLIPIWEGINLFRGNLAKIKSLFEDRGISIAPSDLGLDVPSLGISLYSHDFQDSLDCSADSVYVELQTQRRQPNGTK